MSTEDVLGHAGDRRSPQPLALAPQLVIHLLHLPLLLFLLQISDRGRSPPMVNRRSPMQRVGAVEHESPTSHDVTPAVAEVAAVVPCIWRLQLGQDPQSDAVGQARVLVRARAGHEAAHGGRGDGRRHPQEHGHGGRQHGGGQGALHHVGAQEGGGSGLDGAGRGGRHAAVQAVAALLRGSSARPATVGA
ncbi:hypothetical protein ON010_g17518 [Phytophthora cinnamomi]|nr:hypothetical protein ON010_g17518 [Phytophthora cinnamomi]